jgi:hypothetical protein
MAGSPIIGTGHVSGQGLVSPTQLDVSDAGILWLTSFRAGRWEH